MRCSYSNAYFFARSSSTSVGHDDELLVRGALDEERHAGPGERRLDAQRLLVGSAGDGQVEGLRAGRRSGGGRGERASGGCPFGHGPIGGTCANSVPPRQQPHPRRQARTASRTAGPEASPSPAWRRSASCCCGSPRAGRGSRARPPRRTARRTSCRPR